MKYTISIIFMFLCNAYSYSQTYETIARFSDEENGSFVSDYTGDSDTPGYGGDAGWFNLSGYSGGIENNVNIDVVAIGGGGGKASFRAITLNNIILDEIYTRLKIRMVNQESYDRLEIVRICTSCSGHNGEPELTMDIRLALLSNIDLINPIEFTTTIRYGAMKRSYRPSRVDGTLNSPVDFIWSQVSNEANLEVD
jgi:type VI secretion system secreted protein Hcp